MTNSYNNQDRGSKTEYQQYLEAMDAISVEKIASASVFFKPEKGNTIVDVGMASGTSSAILAHLFPTLRIVGVDINPTMVQIANENYSLPNLSFKEDDGEKLSSFAKNSIDGFFNCSAIHHITSYNNYSSNRAIRTLRRQVELLKENGILIIRDFVKPKEQEVILELSILPHEDRPNDAELFIEFSKTARSLSASNEQGFPCTELDCEVPNCRRFQLFYTDAVEFIRRKDYYANWEVELQEEYGYFTQDEFENVFRELGLRIVHSAPIHNQWIITNRYKDQFVIRDLEGNDIGFPPTNYLIVGEKTNGGKEIKCTRHLPLLPNPFLQHESYLNTENNEIFDIVKRPNMIFDILPYYSDNQNITILAKHGYPRPIANVRTEYGTIDGKYNSGYITELLSVTATDQIEKEVAERYSILDYEKIESSLQYYTSPGGINERVSSFSISLNQCNINNRTLQKNLSGFKTSGSIYTYDAVQLLNTAQTGALIEARLEINIYHLLFKLQIPLPTWLGLKPPVPQVDQLKVRHLRDLLSLHSFVFKSSSYKADFLEISRGYFTEIGEEDSNNILEYVYPKKLSANTIVTLPVCRKDKEIYVGLEVRKLPIPQLYNNNSTLIVAPAKRLPKDITTIHLLDCYLSELTIGGSKVVNFAKLGEKYSPSIGVTTEQVYPYIVNLDHCCTDLHWVSLRELYKDLERIEDAHLLIAIYRLIHALKGDS